MTIQTRATTKSRSSIFAAAWLLSIGFTAHAPANAATSCPANDFNAVQGRVTLAAGCTYNSQVKIVASGTRLDCRGAVFDGRDEIEDGLLIDGQTGELRDIEIRNCTFRRFKNTGIRILLTGSKGERDEAFRRAPQDIMIDSITIEDSGGAGLYLNAYVNKVTLRNSVIRGSRSPAVYLSHSTRDNRIVDNRFYDNGFDAKGKAKREALAIDSSAGNLIRGNLFANNGRGGIFLYKNCGEKSSQGSSPTRWQHSDNNQIVDNQFVNEAVGVWVASRQSLDLSQWDCGDAAMDGTHKYYEDFANSNQISDNRFCAVKVGVRVEGDQNRVVGNRYDDRTKSLVEIPRTKRGEILGRPPVGNVVDGNSKASCPLVPLR